MQHSNYEVCNREGQYKRTVIYSRHSARKNYSILIAVIIPLAIMAYGVMNVPEFGKLLSLFTGAF